MIYQESINLLKDHKPLRKIKEKVNFKLTKYVTQNVQKIDKLYLCYGIKDLSQNAEELSQNNRLLENIEKAVESRHLIVHEGDLNKNLTVRRIEVNNLMNKIRDIDRYVASYDKIINNSIK